MATRAERIELALVAAAVALTAVAAPRLPRSVELGSLGASAALALLGQGFLRDLWRLRRQRVAPPDKPAEEARCLCVESTIGLTGVLTGVALTALGVTWRVGLPAWAWPALGTLVWAAGYAMKDLVLQWRPWRVRRMRDHGSIIVRWR